MLKSKKIVFIITGLGVGGAERQVCDLADKYVQLGHRVLFVVLGGDVNNRPSEQSVSVMNLNMKKTPLGFISAYIKARKIIREFEPDVVHSHMVHANIFARLLRLVTKYPTLVCTAHNTNEGGKIRMLAYRLTDRLANISTNVSQDALTSFLQKKAVPDGRMIVMGNGIDIAKFQFNSDSRDKKRKEVGICDSVKLILAVGRLTEAKDYPNLLKAFSLLKDQSDCQLAIIGAGHLKNSLKTLATSLEIDKRVHWLGLRSDVAEWMSACDIFVLASQWEGLPLVVAEAMSCKRIVVGTDSGGVKEMIRDSGILVPIKDHVKLAESIDNALQMPIDEIIIRGENARRIVESDYSLDVISKRWLSIYNEY